MADQPVCFKSTWDPKDRNVKADQLNGWFGQETKISF